MVHYLTLTGWGWVSFPTSSFRVFIPGWSFLERSFWHNPSCLKGWTLLPVSSNVLWNRDLFLVNRITHRTETLSSLVLRTWSVKWELNGYYILERNPKIGPIQRSKVAMITAVSRRKGIVASESHCIDVMFLDPSPSHISGFASGALCSL